MGYELVSLDGVELVTKSVKRVPPHVRGGKPVRGYTSAYQPKTGAKCSCRPGVERDNCPNCEGTGMVVDFAAIRARNAARRAERGFCEEHGEDKPCHECQIEELNERERVSEAKTAAGWYADEKSVKLTEKSLKRVKPHVRGGKPVRGYTEMTPEAHRQKLGTGPQNTHAEGYRYVREYRHSSGASRWALFEVRGGKTQRVGTAHSEAEYLAHIGLQRREGKLENLAAKGQRTIHPYVRGGRPVRGYMQRGPLSYSNAGGAFGDVGWQKCDRCGLTVHAHDTEQHECRPPERSAPDPAAQARWARRRERAAAREHLRATTFSGAAGVLGKRSRRKVGRATYLERRGGDIAVKYHATDVVTFHPDETATLRTGGWHTVTTKRRFKQHAPQAGVHQKQFGWYHGSGVPFSEGMTIDTRTGAIVNQGTDWHPENVTHKSVETIEGVQNLLALIAAGGLDDVAAHLTDEEAAVLAQKSATAAQRAKMGKVMHEFKHHELHSGTGVPGKKRKGKVRKRSQAIAIGLSESGQSRKSAGFGATCPGCGTPSRSTIRGVRKLCPGCVEKLPAQNAAIRARRDAAVAATETRVRSRATAAAKGVQLTVAV